MDSQERFENMVGLVEAHQYEWAIWQAARRTMSADASAQPVGYGKKSQLDAIVQNGSALLYSVACPDEDWDVPVYLAAPTPERAQECSRPAEILGLLDEIDRLNAEWMAKCEELRKDIDRYQALCAAVYQMAGTVNAPARFLDALSDAANGELEMRAPTESLLPVDATESGCFPPWSAVEAINAERERTIEECATMAEHCTYLAQAVKAIRALAKKEGS